MDQTRMLVPAPFDSPDRADFVIQASDGQYLFVRKIFLIQASVFFANLFADSFPDETHHGLPMHRVQEDTHTMYCVLRLCYPITDFPWSSDEDPLESPVLPALQKYIMDDAITRLRRIVFYSDEISERPLRIFAVACQQGWDDVAKVAARYFISEPLRRQVAFEEMRMITGLDYHRLLEYFWRCSDAVVESLKDSHVLPFSSIPFDLRLQEVLTDQSTKCPTCGVYSVAFSGTRISRKIGATAHSTSEYVCYGHPWIAMVITYLRDSLRDQPGVSLTRPDLVEGAANIAQQECGPQSYVGARCLLEELDKAIGFILDEIEPKFDNGVESI